MSKKFVQPLILVCLIFSLMFVPNRASLAQTGVDVAGAFEKGFTFMKTIQTETGGLDGMGAGADVGTTARFVLALAAMEMPVNEVASSSGKTTLDYLQSEAKNFAKGDGVLKPGRAGLLLAAAAASGADVNHFGEMDLVSEMKAVYDPNFGTYGTATLTTVPDQSWAILGLSMVGESIPAEATNWLIAMQVVSSTVEVQIGGWDSGWGVDPDTTGLAVTALMSSGNVAGADAAVENARGYFKKNQLATGGWRTEWDTAGNPNSTAWGIQALMAAGDDLTTWAAAEGDPVSELVHLQNENGSFGPYANGFSTVEALMALAQKPVYQIKGGKENQENETRMGIVIDFGGGRVESHCLTLSGEKTSGLDALTMTGVSTEQLVDPGLGAAICKVQDVGCPKDNCWCSKPNYWGYWHLVNGEWTYSEKGASQSQADAGKVEAWVWGGGDKPSIKPDLMEICDANHAIKPEENPTLTPAAAIESTATAAPVVKVEPSQPAEDPTATPTAMPALQGEFPIAPLIILGLVVAVLVGVLLFLRSRQ